MKQLLMIAFLAPFCMALSQEQPLEYYEYYWYEEAEAWRPHIEKRFVYNEDEQLVQRTEIQFLPHLSTPREIWNIYYLDPKGDTIQRINQVKFQDQDLKNSRKYYQDTLANGEIFRIDATWEDGEWQDQSRTFEKTSYEGETRVSETIQAFLHEGQWEELFKKISHKDSLGREIKKISYSWIRDHWKIEQQAETEYSQWGHFTRRYTQGFQGNIHEYKYDLVYDDSGNRIESTTFHRGTEHPEWRVESMSYYQYDSLGRTVRDHYLNKADLPADRFQRLTEISYRNDTISFTTSFSQDSLEWNYRERITGVPNPQHSRYPIFQREEIYQDGEWQLENEYHYHLSYDSHDNLEEVKRIVNDGQTQYEEGVIKYERTYSPEGAITSEIKYHYQEDLGAYVPIHKEVWQYE
ncbi:MAG: hypothetical protein AAF927_32505 [Bacteroidota bacterium]